MRVRDRIPFAALGGLLVVSITSPVSANQDWGSLPTDHWLVGAQMEYSHSRASRIRSLDALRIGIGVAYRYRAWGPHARLMVSPSTQTYEAFNGQVRGGLRSHFEAAGIFWSYGVALSAEVRLLDHLWLAHATPLEVGAVVFERGTLRVSLLGGVRRAIAGHWINSVWIDPNGLDNNSARANLHLLEDSHPWEAFVTVDFARLL